MTLAFEGIGLELGGRAVLRDVSATLAPGRVTVLLGPNGAGKSTLLGLAVGLRRARRGRVLLDGRPIESFPPRERARRIGYLPQGGVLHWNIAVRELVALGRSARRGAFGPLLAEDKAAVDRALAATETMAFADRLAGDLSGGERARVLLARVLAGEPDWILADEPLASLDPAHQLDVADRLAGIARGGTGVVLVLHDLMLAARVADDVLLLKEGTMAAFGAAGEVLTAELLEKVYGVEVMRLDGPDGRQLLVPTGRRPAT